MDTDPPSLINSLPEEVFIEIFNFLEKDSLIISSLVCRRWNLIIQSSPSLLGNFRLIFKIDPETRKEQFAEIKNLKRKIHSLSVYEPKTKMYKYEQEALCNLVSTAKDLILHPRSFKFVTDLLPDFKFLQVLHLQTNSIFRDVPKNSEIFHPVQLPNLKSLNLKNVAYQVLPLIVTPNLLFFEFQPGNLEDIDWRKRTEISVNFLASCEKLKMISFSAFALKTSFSEEVHMKFSFKLKEIRLWKVSVNQNFLKFLKHQADSLEGLYLDDMCLKDISTVLELSFKDLKVKLLEIRLGLSEAQSSSFENLKTTIHLKEIGLVGARVNRALVEEILVKAPNIEKIWCDTCGNDCKLGGTLPLIAGKNCKLHYLQICDLAKFDVGMTIEKLKMIVLRKFPLLENLVSFLRRHPSIETVEFQSKFNNSSKIQKNFVETLESLAKDTKLRVLDFKNKVIYFQKKPITGM